MKKNDQIPVRCLDCRHATLRRWGIDPVIAYCRYSDYGEVAAKPRRCSKYEKGKTGIEHLPKQTGWWHERVKPQKITDQL